MEKKIYELEAHYIEKFNFTINQLKKIKSNESYMLTVYSNENSGLIPLLYKIIKILTDEEQSILFLSLYQDEAGFIKRYNRDSYGNVPDTLRIVDSIETFKELNLENLDYDVVIIDNMDIISEKDYFINQLKQHGKTIICGCRELNKNNYNSFADEFIHLFIQEK